MKRTRFLDMNEHTFNLHDVWNANYNKQLSEEEKLHLFELCLYFLASRQDKLDTLIKYAMMLKA